MMRQLLETNFRMQIYREYGDWLHVLYAAHVQPTLSSHYKNVKGSVGHANRYHYSFLQLSESCIMPDGYVIANAKWPAESSNLPWQRIAHRAIGYTTQRHKQGPCFTIQPK